MAEPGVNAGLHVVYLLPIIVMCCNKGEAKMATTVYKDKRSGITYAYESVSYWDKEKKQSRAKHTLVGPVENETGAIIPTGGRGRKQDTPAAVKRWPGPSIQSAPMFYGATYLLDAIAEELGIAQDLKQYFRVWNSRVYRLCIASFSSIKIRFIALKNEVNYISILTAKTSLPSVEAKSLLPFRREAKIGQGVLGLRHYFHI